MTKHSLSASTRLVSGRKVKQLRVQKLIPANVFGKHIESKPIQIAVKDFEKLHKQAGDSTLIYLKVEGESEERPVLIREIAKNPVTGQILHLTLNQVSLKEKVSATVPLNLIGESPADRDKQGILVKMIDEVEVEALPTDIPEALEIDLSVLAEVGSSILVSDLKVIASKVTITTNPETIIVKIEPLAAEEVTTTEPEATPSAEATPTDSAEQSEAQAESTQE